MKRSLAINLLVLTLLAFCISGETFAQKRKTKIAKPPDTISVKATVNVYGGDTPRGLTPAKQRRWDSFIKVWETVDRNYFDRTFNGLDWNKIKSEYRPRVLAAKTDLELSRILTEMVRRLNKSHFAVIPKEVYDAVENAKQEARKNEKAAAEIGDESSDDDDESIFFDSDRARYGVGIDLRIVKGKFVITYVEDPSAAKLGGIKPGYILDKINGYSLSDMVSQAFLMYPNFRNLDRLFPSEIVNSTLNGLKDTPIVLTCIDENDKPREFRLNRQRLLGESVSIGLNYPPQYLRFESRGLTNEIGYIKFNLFSLGVIDKFCAALTELKDKKAIIIDIRGNVGGLLGVFVGLTGMLSEHELDVGMSMYRSGNTPFRVLPKAKRYTGRVVVLVDGQSMSAAELFAAGLRDNDRVVLVGDRTAGEALPASSVNLSTGAVFIYPIANFKTKKDKFIEGSGVEPDFVVELDRIKLIQGIDTQFERAMTIIKENKNLLPKAAPIAPAATGEIKLETLTKLGDADIEMPPPKAAPKTSGSGLSTGVRAAPVPPPPMAIQTPNVKDEKSLQIIRDAVQTTGIDSLKKITSYELTADGVLTAIQANTAFKYKAYMAVPDKFAYVMTIPSAGDIHEVHNDKESFYESDFGMTYEYPVALKASKVEIFAGLTMLADLSQFSSLTYRGDFDRDGRKCSIIEARYQGVTFAMAFDVEKKVLVSFAGPGLSIVYNDYRKVSDGASLPFFVQAEHLYDIRISDVRLNVPVDASRFQRKANCFDRPL